MNQSTAGKEGAPTVRYAHQIEVKVFLASVVGVLASSAAVSWLALAQLVPSYISAWTESQRLALEEQTLAIQSILAENDVAYFAPS